MKRLFRFSAGRAGAARDVNDELRFHIDMRAKEFVAQGMNAEDARRAAERAFGDYTSIEGTLRTERLEQVAKEERREWFGDVVRDFRHAARTLRRSPGFTVAAVATIALGIGAYTAIFSVVHAVLLAPLPFREPSQLAFIWSDMTSAGYPRAPLSAPELVDLRTRSTRFQDFGSIWATSATLTGGDEPLQIRTGLVTANFFTVLGAGAARGRTFSADDEAAGAQASIIISWPLWQRRFGGDTGIVGRQIQMGARQVTVIGVMPKDFHLLMPPDAAVPDDLDAWTLLPSAALPRQPRGQQYLRVVGRMKRGVTLAEARSDIAAVGAAISKEFTEYGAEGRTLVTVGLQADGVRLARPMLIALFGGVTILLLIACVNVAGLLVARAAGRTREIAVKLALGARRQRVVRECLAEGLVLTALGGAAGVVLGYGGLRALLALRPPELERIGAAHLNVTVLAFSVATTALCGILLSLAPSSEVFRTNLAGVLQRDGRQTGGSIRHRVRSGLVVAQVALSLVLLVGASLMYRTFIAIQHVDAGFVADSVTTFKINAQGRTLPELNAFGRSLRDRLSALPGVTVVGTVSHLPYDNVPNWGGGVSLSADAARPEPEIADYRSVSPGFMEAVHARLIDGRFFTDDDNERTAPVVIVDQQLAGRLWPGVSAVGRDVLVDPGSNGTPTTHATVVGVVAHMRQRSIVETLNDQVFFPVQQAPRSPYCFALRTSGAPLDASAVRRAVADVAPRAALGAFRPLDSYVLGARAPQRFTSVLASTFAIAALLLTSIGLFGVVAYAASRRTYEFGIRLALGAQPAEVRMLVAREALALTIGGVAIGVIGAMAGARWITSQLYGVGAFDPLSYGIPLVAVIVATVAAAWLPALRAGRVSPMSAIQNG